MLENKVGLIFGVANKRSIAWACASACAAKGARQAFTYQGDRIKENVEELANTLTDSLVIPCDVSDQAQVDATFDAVLVKQDVIYCAEVSFLVAPDLRQERIDAMLRKMARVKTVVEQMGVAMRVMLMIILVTQLTPEDEQRLRKTLNTAKRFPGAPVEIEIRFLDFEALQKIYVTE